MLTNAHVEFGRDGRAEVSTLMHISAASRFQCCHYEGKLPILSIRDRHVSVSISPPETTAVTAEDVATARRLAAELERYIADLELLAASQDQGKATADRVA
jgi:hypothetical protein